MRKARSQNCPELYCLFFLTGGSLRFSMGEVLRVERGGAVQDLNHSTRPLRGLAHGLQRNVEWPGRAARGERPPPAGRRGPPPPLAAGAPLRCQRRPPP